MFQSYEITVDEVARENANQRVYGVGSVQPADGILAQRGGSTHGSG